MTAPDAPVVDEQLRAALEARSHGALAAALRTSGFLLALATGGTPAVATAGSGTRSVVAFSGPDAAQAWGGVARLRLVDGAELLRAAEHQQVDSVLLDPAGPAPAEFVVPELRQLGDGLSRDVDGGLRVVAPLEVRPASPPAGLVEAVAAAVTQVGAEAWVFERRGLTEAVLTVGVAGTPEQAGAVAERVAAVRGLPTTDVLVLDEQVVEHLVEQVPEARITR